MKKVFGGPLCLLVLCSANLFAQDNGRMPGAVHTPEKSQIHVPAAETTLTRIFSNLGPAANTYNDTEGFLLAGPASGSGQVFLGVAFTPKADSTITVIRAALLFVDEGNGAPNQINVSLYNDAGGVPGEIIRGPHTITNLPEPGTCCTLATWPLSKGVSVLAGVQYWVVADTPATGTGSDSSAVWDVVFPSFPQASNEGTGWGSFNGDSRLGLAVLGTVPLSVRVRMRATKSSRPPKPAQYQRACAFYRGRLSLRIQCVVGSTISAATGPRGPGTIL